MYKIKPSSILRKDEDGNLCHYPSLECEYEDADGNTTTRILYVREPFYTSIEAVLFARGMLCVYQRKFDQIFDETSLIEV